MRAPARIWLSDYRRLYARSRAQLAALALTAIVAWLFLPAPWEEGVHAAKERTYPERELVELRSAKTKTTRQADGSLVTRLSEQSLHYFDRAAEKWKEIDASFKDSQRAGKRWESGANRFSVELAEQAKEGFVTLQTEEGALSFSLEAGREVTGVKAGANAITFKDAIADVDLEYVVLPDGLKETIVLRKAGAPTEYRFRLTPAAGATLTAEEREDGSVWFFREGRSEPAFTLLAPVIGDSSDQALPQQEAAVRAPSSWSAAPGKASMEVEEDEGSFLVTLKIDEKWLADESRVYPVVLDPTLYVQPDSADGEYDTTNGGNPNVTATEIRTGRNGAGGAKYASVLNFDLATIPPGAKVLDARLFSYLNACFPTTCGTGHTGDVELRRLTSGWDASTPWSAVTKDSTLQDKITFSTTPTATWYRWSSGTFTQTVQSFVNGALPNYGLILEKAAGNDTIGYKWRSSRYTDPSYAPYLEVYWVADGVQVDPSQHLHADGAELFWQHYAGGTSAYADAVFEDAPVAYYRLDEGAGDTTVWDWAGNDVTATIQTPTGAVRAEPGALADGDTSTKLAGSPAGYVKVPDDPVIRVNDTFTLEAWVRRLDLTARDMAVFNDFGTGFWLRVNSSNRLQLLRNGSQASPITTSTSTIADTNWHHIAATKSGAAVKLYIDGNDVTGTVSNLTMTSSTSGFHIGITNNIDQPWYGWIDEATLYPTALSATRVSAHYAAAATPMPGFERFEIHRSATANFTPSASTLVGAVADPALQHFRDTTAKSGETFYYEVVTVTDEGSFSSNELEAELPAQGESQVTIQPGFLSSSAAGTHISSGSPSQEAGNSQGIIVGSAGSNTTRALITFDMRLVPTGATVTSAKLELYAFGTTPQISAHRVSAQWWEGGATWLHREKYSSQFWAVPGGDFDSSPVASSAGGDYQHWDSWEIGSLLQEWIDGTSTHHGVLLKYGSENGSQSTLVYGADGLWRSIALRPRLVITYEDGSEAVEPTVAISQPQAGALLKGQATVKAGALDDGRVTQVEFFLEGQTSLGTDTTAPYEVSWNTVTASRGSHTLAAKATDDAGNVTTSQGVQVTVANSQAPSVAVTGASPQGGAANVPPTASAQASPSSGAAPLEVDFAGSGQDADGTIAAFAWDLDGDGAYDDSTAQNPSFEYSSNGLYYARLRVTDDDGAYGFSTPVTISVGSASQAPSVVGWTTDSGSDFTSGAWTLPSGWQAGDLLLVWLYARSGAMTITEGSTITQKIDSNAGSNSYGRMFVGYRYLQAGDSDPTFTLSSSPGTTVVGGAVVLRGGPSSGDPFEAASSVLGVQDAQDPNPPPVTTVTGNALVLTLVGKNNDSTSPNTPPSGFTGRGFIWETAGNDASGGAASKVRATAGTEDPGPWDLGGSSSDDGIAWTASVPPAGGGGGNAPPSASAQASPTSGTAPLEVDFTGSGQDADGTIAAYSWDLDGDGAYDDSSAQNPSYEYAQAGTYRAWLRVTDNEGAYGFSGPVTITVGGSDSTWSVTASASDDIGVERVEFFVDGDRFAEDTSSPYAATLPTLSFPVYDGQHEITAKAYDEDGNVATSTATEITVENTSGTKYKGTIETQDVPLELSFDPAASDPSFPLAAVVEDFDEPDGVLSGATWNTPDMGCLDTGAQMRYIGNRGGYQSGGCSAAIYKPGPWGDEEIALDMVEFANAPVCLHVRAQSNSSTWSPSYAVCFDPANDELSFWDGGTQSSSTARVIDDGDSLGLRVVGSALTVWRKPSGGSWSQVWGLTVSNPSVPSPGYVGFELTSPSQRVDNLRAGVVSVGQDASPLTVSLQNTSTQNWPTASTKLRYRWFSTDAQPVVTDSQDVSIGADLAASGQRNVELSVDPPELPTGVDRARYKLRIDLYDTAASAYFAAAGNKPYETWVTVTREVSNELGLERFQYYSGEDLGGGFDSALNLANGNSIVQWVPFAQPGRGLNTVVTMTYNSLEHGSVSPLGNNWSLAISSLTPFGLPLDVHPNASDTAAGRTQKWVGFTDGDGSYHVFQGNAAGTYYTAPAGVHLYLKALGGGGWELWKPDRTKFVYDAAGFPTSVSDASGNALTYTLQTPAAGEDAYGLQQRVTTVTDAGGRDFTLTYYSKAETPTPAMRGKLKKLTGHVGHALELTYYEDGNLRSIREKGGPGQDGMPTPDREVVFTYTTPDGTGPAITPFSARQNPDPATVQSPKLYSVIDFRGAETTFAYSTAADETKWRLTSRTNRTGNQSTFAYDTQAREATETMPLSRVWTYTFDAEGRVTEIEDPVNAQPTTVEWADEQAPNEVANTVRKVTQPTGEYVEYAYNANGYRTDEWDELRNHETFEYESIAVDANDASGNWEAGRSIPHLSQLTAVVKPKGNATTGNPADYRWELSYTSNGLVDEITDPLGNVTDNSWNGNGTLAAQTLPANGDGITRTTTFDSYDLNGLPTKVTDAAGGIAQAGYAANGNLLFEQDPNHGSYTGGTPSEYRSEYLYDAFGRLVRSSQPKSTTYAPGLLVWEGMAYDANDNEVQQVAPHYGRGDGGNGALTTTTFDAMDRETLVTGPRTAGQGGPVKEKTEYDAAGRVTRVTEAKGVDSAPADDYVTETAYDLLDRELTVTAHATESGATRVTSYCYDDAGDLRSLTGPKGAASFAGCPSATADPYVYTTATHTTKLVYDDAHRQIKTIDALGNETETAYDENGAVTAETDEADEVTETFYDDRGLQTKVVEPFDTGRTLTTLFEYSALGNLKRLISPRAFDAAGGQAPYTDFVESYAYDALQRLVTTTLPRDASTTQAYRHQAFDANGQTLWTSLATTASTPGAVTAQEKTQLTYWDTGEIYSSQDPANPKVRFEYTAEGWQASRIPEYVGSAGSLEYAKAMYWEYLPDGLLAAHVDQERQRALYDYDQNGNRTQALDATGIVSAGQTPLQIELVYNSLDELTEVRTPKPGVSGTYLATLLAYDLHGNTEQLTDNREEDGSGSQTAAGRVFTYTYNAADQATAQTDDFLTSGTTDDEQILYAYTPRGELEQQTLQKRPSGSWANEQSSERAYFANGLLETLVNRNGAGTTISSHTLSYLEAGVYLNGNRVSDAFLLKGPDATAPCYAATCTATWTYDARERLTQENPGTGSPTSFTLDTQGNVTQEVTGASTTTRTYAGQQLQTEDFSSGTDKRYLYDSLGSLDCVTKLAYAGASCPAGGDANLLEDNLYDYKSRLSAFRAYNGSGSLTKTSSYTNDPLDRPVRQVDWVSPSTTTTIDFTYVGVTNALSKEVLTGATSTTKKYAYDAFGQRATISEGSNRYSYLYDPHGSVSLLLDQANAVKESYGYTAYGQSNAALSKSASGFDNQSLPKNPYRYTGKRLDSGSGTYDMGARRYSASTGRFLQYDVFYDVLQNLGLSQDPLSQNRYALAGGNPIGFVEIDGHAVADVDETGNTVALASPDGGYWNPYVAVDPEPPVRSGGGVAGGGGYRPNFCDIQCQKYAYGGTRGDGRWGQPPRTGHGRGTRGRQIVSGEVPAFDKAGIAYTRHFADGIAQRGARGVTGTKALRAYNRGSLFHDPRTGNFIRYDRKTGVAVVQLGSKSGPAHTVFITPRPPDRWNPVRYRSGK